MKSTEKLEQELVAARAEIARLEDELALERARREPPNGFTYRESDDDWAFESRDFPAQNSPSIGFAADGDLYLSHDDLDGQCHITHIKWSDLLAFIDWVQEVGLAPDSE
jgi:hypothetical protein